MEELPGGVDTITGVSTAVAAYLGYFWRRPMDEAVRILNVADLESVAPAALMAPCSVEQSSLTHRCRRTRCLRAAGSNWRAVFDA